MITIFDTSIFGDFFKPFTLKTNQVYSQDRIVVVGRQFCRCVPNEQIDQLVDVDASTLHHILLRLSPFLPSA
ncbi:MAG TPA: hypothetical protein VGU64_21980 [Terriglobales bacterium]|nr:hypothetical protein [Terriglobales bacterium]